LRDAQAALGQLCVQKKDYARAESLYLAAFASESEEDEEAEEDKQGRPAGEGSCAEAADTTEAQR